MKTAVPQYQEIDVRKVCRVLTGQGYRITDVPRLGILRHLPTYVQPSFH